MAKNKNSTALFEVISHGRPLSRQPRMGLFRAAAWFGTRPVGTGSDPVYRSIPGSAPETGPISTPAALQPALHTNADSQSPAFSFDPNRREVLLRLSYMSTVIAVFAIATLVASAFLVGRRVTLAHHPIIAPDSTEQLRAGPTQANVVDLRPDREPPRVDGSNPAAPKTPAPAQPLTRTRNIGVNYVVIQSYPEEKMAAQAMNLLIQNGIDCNVVKSLPGWGTSGWYSVVSFDGFSQITNSQKVENYFARIRKISDSYAKRGSFKAFAPALYKWKAQG